LHLLRDLNPQQREAVTSTEGPLLVLAGAGTGKTRVLAYRIAYLLGHMGVGPGAVLAVTFTRKAAGEMRDRVESLVGRTAGGMWIGTFHSICARILRYEARSLGFPANFTIYDEQDQAALVKQIIRKRGYGSQRSTPAGILSRISWVKSQLVTAEEFAAEASTNRDRGLAEIYSAYESGLRANNALDFDDLIVIPVRLFRANKDLLASVSGRFRYILIDEYQDTNTAQYELVRLLSSEHGNVCAVGDDDQSIYQWRGADVTNILSFERDFPGTRVIRIEESYRSTKTILAAAQSVIRCNRRRKDKELWTANPVGRKIGVNGVLSEEEEGRFVAATVAQSVREEGRSLSEIAVLYRTNAQSRAVEDALRRQGIPYVLVGGTRFYERKEIKDIVAYLRVIANPKDSVSLRRILNVPPRGIGEVTLGRLEEFADKERVSLGEAVTRVSEIDTIGPGFRRKLQDFNNLVGEIRRAAGTASIGELIGSVAEKTRYMAYLEEQQTPDAVARLENIRELAAGAYEFEERSDAPTLQAFLEEIALLMDIDLWDDRKERVSLMTLHNAKGLEFSIVFIMGVEEGLLPHHTALDDEAELEEERRLFYVGLTRARERAFISLATGRRGFHGLMTRAVSRFLHEIPPEYLEYLSDIYETGQAGGDADYTGEEIVIRTGAWVKHPDWGIGRVKTCEGYGRDLRVTVDFGHNNVKKVLARFANLELVDEGEEGPG
jgi:DNA helicase-2/ATP-dependent DNA helicase PcrA